MVLRCTSGWLRSGAMSSLLVSTVMAAWGCDSNAPSAAAAAPSGPRGEAIRRLDSGVPLDAAEPDASTAILTGDRQVLCTYEEADLFAFDGTPTGAVPAVAADERGFAMVFQTSAGQLYVRAVPAWGEPDAPVLIAEASEQVAGPLLAVADGDFLLGFRHELDDRLFARSLEADGSGPQLIGDRVATDGDGRALVALAATGGGFTLAFVDGDGDLQLRRLSSSGQVEATKTHEDPFGMAPADLHLGYFDDGGAIVSWAMLDDEGRGTIVGRALDADYEWRGDAFDLSTTDVSPGRFGFAVHGDSAGVIYPSVEGDVRDTIKFRRIERDGSAAGPLLNIVNAPRRTGDGSIAPFGQGYVVSHRVLMSRGEQQQRIEVSFVNQYGSIVYRGSIGYTSSLGGATAVAANEGGHVLAAWTTVARDGTATTHAAKLHCPGALVLCGGTL